MIHNESCGTTHENATYLDLWYLSKQVEGECFRGLERGIYIII